MRFITGLAVMLVLCLMFVTGFSSQMETLRIE